MAGVQFNPIPGSQGLGGGGGAAPVQVGIQQIGGGGQQAVAPAHSWYQQGMETNLGGANWPTFLDEVFAEPRAAAKQERMWKGFADGVAGITAEEVREQKPWFMNLFGTSDYDKGMMLYETQQKVSDLAMTWQDRMPSLRELPHEQVTELLVSDMNAMRSSDPFANALLDKNMMETFAPIIQQHGKERIAWQQGRMVQRQVTAAESRNAYYQRLASQAASLGQDGPMDPAVLDNLLSAEGSVLDVYTTGDLQNDESKKAFLTTASASAMRQGQFHVVELLRRNGFMDAMSAEDAERFEKQYVTAQAQYRNRYATENPEFLEMIAKTQALKSRGVGGLPIVQRMEEINRLYQSMTGAPQSYYDADQIANAAGESTAAWLRKEERLEDKKFSLSLRAMDAEEKAELEARNTAQLTRFFLEGGAGEAINLKNVERGDMDRASSASFNQAMQQGNVEGAVGMLVRNFNNLKGSYKNEMISDQFRSNLENSMDEQVTDGFMAQYGVWKMMYGAQGYDNEGNKVDNAQGRATAIGYYTPQVSAKMLEFDRKLQTMGQERAYATTFGEWVANGRPDFRGIESGDQKKNVQAFLSAMDKMDDAQSGGWLERTFGDGIPLHPTARIQFAQAVAPYVEQLGADGMLPEHQMKAAVQLAMNAGGIEFAGGQILRHGRNQQPLGKYLNDTDGKRTSALFHSVLTSKAKDAGTKVDGNSVIIHRLKDEGGVPVYTVHIESDDGFEDFDIKGTDLEAAEDKIIAQIDKVNAARAENRRVSNTPTTSGQLMRTDGGIPLGIRVPENVPLTPDDYRRIHEMDIRRKAQQN